MIELMNLPNVDATVWDVPSADRLLAPAALQANIPNGSKRPRSTACASPPSQPSISVA